MIWPTPSADSWQGAAVELGGCYRVLLDGEYSLRQLDATAVAGLLG